MTKLKFTTKSAIALSIMLYLAFLCVGCDEQPTYKNEVVKEETISLGTREYDQTKVKTVVIDSCEYLYAWFGMANGGGSLTHKGNCKFCRARVEKH